MYCVIQNKILLFVFSDLTIKVDENVSDKGLVRCLLALAVPSNECTDAQQR
jgi:hypothetical protein